MTEAAQSYRQVLRLPAVAELLLTACWARRAGRMFTLAIVFYALQRFDSPALAGWIAFTSMLPGMVVSPIAGALLDRFGAARIILIDLVASAALLAALVVLDVVRVATPAAVLILVGLYSLTSPLSSAGIRTLIPRLVPAEARDRANALDTSINALVGVLGPVLAGLLFGFAGGAVTMAVIAALYAVAALSLLPLIRRPDEGRAGARGRLMHDAIAGLRYVLRHGALRGLAVSYALYMASKGVLLIAVPVLVAREMATQASTDSLVGLLWAASGIAGSVGALGAGSARTLGREHWMIVAGTLGTALACWPVGAIWGLYGLAVGLLLVGLTQGPVDVGTLTLRQRVTDPAWLGRSLAVSMSLNLCGLPIGAALGGWLASHAASLLLPVAAAAAVLAAIAAARLPVSAHAAGTSTGMR